MAQRIRVLVVDDSREFRGLLVSILHTDPELQVIAEACNGEEAVQKIETLRPDLVLLDLGLPMLNGLDVARIARDNAPSSKIIIVSQESSPDVVHEALSSGAYGYVLKSDVDHELLRAVTAVMQSRTFLILAKPWRVANQSSIACCDRLLMKQLRRGTPYRVRELPILFQERRIRRTRTANKPAVREMPRRLAS